MKIFVSGATGAQGGSIANKLILSEHSVVTLSSKENTEVPVEVIKGDFNSSEAIARALNGVDAAVFTLPLLFDMLLAESYAKNFVAAAKNKHVPLVVFNTSFDLAEKESGMIAIDIKVRIKKIFDSSGLNIITLVPDIYLDNFTAPWSIPVILNDGLLPYPIASESKVPFISLSDLGNYVAAAVIKPNLAGKILPIGGNLLTGEEIAASISSHINKTVHFLSVSPNDFEKQLVPAFGELAAREVSNLYRYVEQNNSELCEKDFKQTQFLLSVRPQSLNDWVESVDWLN